MQRILHLTTHGEPCGIADYDAKLRQYVGGFGFHSDFHRLTPTAFDFMTRKEIVAFFLDFVEKAKAYDTVVIQHEYAFFAGPYSLSFGLKNLRFVILALHRADKRIIIVSHTDPSLVNLTGKTNWKLYFSSKRRHLRSIVRIVNKSGISIVVHGSHARNAWLDVGVRDDLILNLFIPLEIPKSLTNSQLPYDGKREVWLTMFGFIGNYKGYQTAIEALHYLPENFRLLIIGGIHPRSRTEFALEKIMRFKATGHWQGDLKKSRPLQLANTSFEDRVIVTGYLKAEEVSSKMQQTDIFLAPYFEGGPSGSAAIAVGLKAGKPVIASKTRSFEEIQYQSQAMKMVTPGAPAEMAFVVQQLMENEAERIDLVDKILQFAKTRTWDDYVMRLGLKQHKN